MRYRNVLLPPKVEERDVNALQSMLSQALGVLAVLNAGRPAHQHQCPADVGSHQWYCTSPYCEPPFEAECPDHGGSPVPYVTATGTPVERWS